MEQVKGQKVGFIGLGLMGRPMVENLRDAGVRLVIHNRSRQVVDELVAEGGVEAADDPAGVARQVADGVIVLCLTRTSSVGEVFAGEKGLLANISAGALVVDMGTSAVKTTRQLDAALREKGASLVDAPVSGGQGGSQGSDPVDHGGRTPGGFCPRPALV